MAAGNVESVAPVLLVLATAVVAVAAAPVVVPHRMAAAN